MKNFIGNGLSTTNYTKDMMNSCEQITHNGKVGAYCAVENNEPHERVKGFFFSEDGGQK